MEARQDGYAVDLEGYFRRRLVDGYRRRSEELWQRDHSSTEAFLASVAERRTAWRQLLNPPPLTPSSPPVSGGSVVPEARWLTVRCDEGLSAEGLLVTPPGAHRLVVFQHGLGSLPERVFGVGDEAGAYDAVGTRLVEAGYAVLAPMNLIGIPQRNRAQSLARLAGTTVEGLEFSRLQALLACLPQVVPEVAVDAYALAGMSWGGLAAQYWTPLDDRIAVAVSSGFFNHRPNKMVVQDSRYVTFADTGEDHAFLHGMLDGFDDADLASLVCPRPMMVQLGRADRIGWWPQAEECFHAAAEHWRLLGVAERIDLQFHDGGHEVEAGPIVEFLHRWFPAR